MSLSRTFSHERGPGTFHTLGDLPKRRRDGPRPAVFHLAHDDDDDHSSSLDEHPAVPFPRSSSPPPSGPPSSPNSPCLQLSRGASAPILLSNGKPLKSSLKSSPSSPSVLAPHQAQHLHLRARSEPSTPVTTPKNVHFPEKDYALATVRIFSRSARPAALSNTNGEDTETDGDEAAPNCSPFPPISPAFSHEIDPTNSSPVPSDYSPAANLVLESLDMSPSSRSSLMRPLLTGSILVRNLAFEKSVAIRFTLDDWQTVSEVGAHYVDSPLHLSLRHLPSPSSSIPEDGIAQGERGWDRFAFTIRLEDYVHSLSTRTLWLAARYRVDWTYPEPGSEKCGSGGEWWDNNGGGNYRISFRAAIPPTFPKRGRARRETVSTPISSPPTRLQLPKTCKEHTFGLMASSVPSNKEAQPTSEPDRRSVPPRAGKLSLCNYAPPTVRTTLSISPSSPRRSSPSCNTNLESPSSATQRLSSDEDTASPASSTLSTPSVSPMMTPRVIINGQPATSVHLHHEEDVSTSSRPGHIADWEWSAPSKLHIEQQIGQRADPVPVFEGRRDIPPSPGQRRLADNNNSLYDAFVKQWCFAQGPSPNHSGYDDGVIMV